jgi:hypothetical protein
MRQDAIDATDTAPVAEPDYASPISAATAGDRVSASFLWADFRPPKPPQKDEHARAASVT